MHSLINLLTQRTTLSRQAVTNTLKLLEEGATIPFIARYRKEMTGGASDESLREFYEIYLASKRLLERKGEILNILAEKELLTPELKDQIDQAATVTALEDIYRPFKEKKNTRAATAIKNGLEPLANTLQSGRLSQQEFESKARQFVRGNVKSTAEAIRGAQDIIAERFADTARERTILRDLLLRHGMVEVKAAKGFDAQGVYKNYKEHKEKVAFIPSHRYLAIKRGEKEKQLSAFLLALFLF